MHRHIPKPTPSAALPPHGQRNRACGLAGAYFGVIKLAVRPVAIIAVYGAYFLNGMKDKKKQDFSCDVVIDGEFIILALLAYVGYLVFGL